MLLEFQRITLSCIQGSRTPQEHTKFGKKKVWTKYTNQHLGSSNSMRGLISLWLYRENNKLRDWKHIFTLRIPLSSTHLWLRCSNFFNPSKKIYFGCAANTKIWNKKSQRLISTPTYIPCSFLVKILYVFVMRTSNFKVFVLHSFLVSYCRTLIFPNWRITPCWHSMTLLDICTAIVHLKHLWGQATHRASHLAEWRSVSTARFPVQRIWLQLYL
jgi:hypothetical protein